LGEKFKDILSDIRDLVESLYQLLEFDIEIPVMLSRNDDSGMNCLKSIK